MTAPITKEQRAEVQALAKRYLDEHDYEAVDDGCGDAVAKAIPAYEAALAAAEARCDGLMASLDVSADEYASLHDDFVRMRAERDTLAAKLTAVEAARDEACDAIYTCAEQGWDTSMALAKHDELRAKGK